MRVLKNWILLRSAKAFIWIGKIRSRIEIFRLIWVRKPIFYVGYNFRLNFGDDLLIEIFRKISQRKVIVSIGLYTRFIPSGAAVVLGGGTIINGAIYLDALLRFRNPRLLCTFYSGVIGSTLQPGWKNILPKFERVLLRSLESKDKLSKVVPDAVSHIDPGVLIADSYIYPRNKSTKKNGGRMRLLLNMHSSGQISKYLNMNYSVFMRLKERFDIVFFVASPVDIVSLDGLSKLDDEIIFSYLGLSHALQSIAEADVVISERLHVGVVAWSYEKPLYAYKYEEKCKEFFSSVGAQPALYESVELLFDSVFSNKELFQNYQFADRLLKKFDRDLLRYEDL